MAQQAQQAQHPNIVVFIPDELRADTVGAFGNELIHTPHIDALAERGARFTNAYVQHPVCSPSRASFLTGWYPHVAGHRTLTHLLKPDEPNFLRTFRDAGYHVTWVGARGDTFAPGTTETSVDEYGFTPGMEPAPIQIDPRTIFPDDLHARLFYIGEVPDILEFDEAATRTAEHWLADPPSEPWLLFIPLTAPHPPFRAPEPYFSMYDRAEVPAPVPPMPEGAPDFHAGIRASYGLDRATPQDWAEVVAVYYGMVTRLDDQFGRVMAALEASPAADHTLVAFFSDHGEFLGDRGLVEKWPSALETEITHDPVIVAGPGIPPGTVIDDMVELIDVFPTLLDLAEVPDTTHHHFGRSLRGALDGEPHRRYAFSEGGFTIEEEPQLERAPFPYDLKAGLQHEQPELVGKASCVRDKRWTYVERLYEPPQLFDRDADPRETRNLAGDPAYADIQAKLADALHRWAMETADVIPLAEDPRSPRVDLPRPGEHRRP